MTWTAAFFSDHVEAEILARPAGHLARFIRFKKTDKTPSKELEVARRRLKEMKHA